MKKYVQIFWTGLVALCLLGIPVRAGAYAGEIRTQRVVEQTEREDGREFTLTYKVWTEDVLGLRKPCRVLLVVEHSAAAESQSEKMEKQLRAFLEELAEETPETGVALIRAGGRVEAGPVLPVGESAESLLAYWREQPPQGQANFPAALSLAAELAEESDGPVCLVTLAVGGQELEAESILRCQDAVQRVRELGGQAFVSMGQEAGEEWQSLASAPVEEHFFTGKDPEPCLQAARQYAVGAFTVEIRERLDPRFTLSWQERRRLESTGAQVTRKDENWEVIWQAELPGDRDRPWSGQLTVEAQKDFPGGNAVPISAEGSGVFAEDRQVGEWNPAGANVGVTLALQQEQAEIFLGETVPTRLQGEAIDARMTAGIPANWYGKSSTGVFSYQWETESGTPVGTTEQMGKSKPEKDTAWRLRVTFNPTGSGAGAAGKPVERLSAEGTYKVTVVPGVLRVRVTGDTITRHTTLPLQIEGAGRTYTCTARPEADPQTGLLTLDAQLTGLPYGRYTVTPMAPFAGKNFPSQTCLLGVCNENDTVDTARAFALVKFSP